MLIGVAICTLDGEDLASPNNAHPQGAHHGLHKYMYRYTEYIYYINFLAVPPFHHTQLYFLLIFVL